MFRIAIASVAALVLGFAGCNLKNESECEPGSVARCTCIDGVPGQAICRVDGTFAACISSATGNVCEELPPPEVDAGVVVKADGGAVVTDGGAVVSDGGAVVSDGGAVVSDGGAAATDGGAVVTDGGAVVTDGGAVATDGGAVATDGGAVATDAGAPTTGSVVVSVTCAGDGCGKTGNVIGELKPCTSGTSWVQTASVTAQTLASGSSVTLTFPAAPLGAACLTTFLDVNANAVIDTGDVVTTSASTGVDVVAPSASVSVELNTVR